MKKISVLAIFILLLAGSVFAYSRITQDKPAERSASKQADEKNSDVLDSKQPVLKPNDQKPKKINGTLKTCKDTSSARLKAVLGEGYSAQTSNGSETLSADVLICEYTKNTKKVRVVIHDFGMSRNAEMAQKGLGAEYQVKREGSVLYAVAVTTDNAPRTDESQKLLKAIVDAR